MKKLKPSKIKITHKPVADVSSAESQRKLNKAFDVLFTEMTKKRVDL